MENIGRACDWIAAGRPTPLDRTARTLSYHDATNEGPQKGKGAPMKGKLNGVLAKGATQAGGYGKGGYGTNISKSGKGNGKGAAVGKAGSGNSASNAPVPDIQQFLQRMLMEFRSQPY